MSNKNRVEWIDCAKGIGILLVIIGHSNGILMPYIQSFHMPLFFILSCSTFKYCKNKEQFFYNIEKSFKHLIIPAYSLFFIQTVLFLCKNYQIFVSIEDIKIFVAQKLLSIIFANGYYINILTCQIDHIGMSWFLVALFAGRTILDYLQLRLSHSRGG